jgi:hypothetical protein
MPRGALDFYPLLPEKAERLLVFLGLLLHRKNAKARAKMCG